MANVFALNSVGNSIVTFLRNAYLAAVEEQDLPACSFDLVSSAELAGELTDTTTRLTLYLYRITVNEHSRQSRRSGAPADVPAPLGLDLHFLLSAWAPTALKEQTTLAWAMRQLHQFPVLDASSLSPEGGWAPDEIIHVIPAELSTEDVMRIWDALDPPYRLSVSYVARVVRLDVDTAQGSAVPAVARRLALAEVTSA
jgi:hypothetical protein